MKRQVTAIVMGLIFSLHLGTLSAQTTTTPPQPAQPASPQVAPPAKPVQQKPASDKQRQPDMGMILMRGLKETPGCLGVKTCRWDDGKQSIVAWFEDKDAAATWYYSATHQAMMKGNTDEEDTEKEPMQHIVDDSQPIMVIASITPSDRPRLPGIKIPISQISIELFRALPGGAQVGGRVSPLEFKVPHMKNYTQK